MAAVSQKKFRRLSRFLPSAAVPNFVSNVHFKEFGMRVFIFLLLLGLLTFGNANVITPTYSPHIPRVWDDAEMAKLQLPLVIPTASPKQVTADYYYRIPVRTIYKNYPVYVPGKEPAGYLEWLKQQEPQSAFEPSTFKTEADWIRAGELVFDSPIFYDNIVREKGKVELGTISCAMCHTVPAVIYNELA
jgi:hypothetical protein